MKLKLKCLKCYSILLSIFIKVFAIISFIFQLVANAKNGTMLLGVMPRCTHLKEKWIV